MKLALAQINTTVGDLNGNAEKVLQYCKKAFTKKASLVIFPELTLTGYPPLDLLESQDFILREQEVRENLAKTIPKELGLLIGGPKQNQDHGKPLYNAAYLYEDGRCMGVRCKQLLPTYDVFDERRYFEPEIAPQTLKWRGINLAIHICEDLWNVHDQRRKPYANDPISILSEQSPDLFINLCASPFAINKQQDRYALIKLVVQRYGKPYVFTNLVGANTDQIFDGRSCVMQDGHVLEAPAFKQALLTWDLDQPPTLDPIAMKPMEQVMGALTLGIRDYIVKSNLPKKTYIGLSGGIDSAVTATLAVQALGSNAVTGVAMPSMYSSKGAWEDAQDLANNLNIKLIQLPIEQLVQSFELGLQGVFHNCATDVTEENIQARIRGTLLMALANKFGGIVLATGNKSELAVGYATLYGDMNGGLSVLGDLYKTEVYELARHINASKPVIPQSSINKPPSAELRPDQKDTDSLPPYDVLDSILVEYIERQKSMTEIIKQLNYSEDLVRSTVAKVHHSEYKRHQSSPVLRLREKAFGSGRRQPVVKRN
ncbi:MAG: NAD+ synthase [Bacteroidetes bacterium]|nr:NAD+ synthase [Bacteroidota bacterium]